MAYAAVIFDLYGTLVHTVPPGDYSAMLGKLAAALSVPVDDFAAQWRSTITERESGELGDLDGVLFRTASAVGPAPGPDRVGEARRRWLATADGWLMPRDDAMATVRAFRDAGYRMGLLSNCSAEVPQLWERGPLAVLFDVTVFSCEAGVMKPDRRVYDAACEQLGVAHERCLYVGDGGARELTGAAAVGMDAVLLRAPGEEHTWFDIHYRQDALEWPGDVVASLAELTRLI